MRKDGQRRGEERSDVKVREVRRVRSIASHCVAIR